MGILEGCFMINFPSKESYDTYNYSRLYRIRAVRHRADNVFQITFVKMQ